MPDNDLWTYKPNGAVPEEDGYIIISPDGREVATIFGSPFGEADAREMTAMLNESLYVRQRAARNNA